MTTEDIKVVNIPQDSLQKVDTNNNYVVRFRVSNEDGSQKSSWSPYLVVPAKTIGTQIPTSSMTATTSDSIVSLQWIVDSASSRPLYDVFVKWSTDGGTTYSAYELVDTVSVPIASALKPDDPSINRVKFKVQVAGLVQEENSNLLLGESGNLTLT